MGSERIRVEVEPSLPPTQRVSVVLQFGDLEAFLRTLLIDALPLLKFEVATRSGARLAQVYRP